MADIPEAIVHLRASGRWNPFLRSVLLILAWLVLSIVYAIPVFVLLAVALPTGGVASGSAVDVIGGTVAQFLAALTVVWLFRRLLDRQNIETLGIERSTGWVSEVTWGVGLGIGLMILTVAVLAAFGWVAFAGSAWNSGALGSVFVWSLVAVIMLAMVGFYEELIFRGYLIQNLAAGSNLLVAVVISSLVFGAAHIMNPSSSWLAAVNTGLAGLFFALVYLSTGSLWAPIGAHFGWNFAQNYLLGLPVSGLDIFSRASPIILEETGPSMATGGSFGPEGGLVVTGVLVGVSLWFLLKLRTQRR